MFPPLDQRLQFRCGTLVCYRPVLLVTGLKPRYAATAVSDTASLHLATENRAKTPVMYAELRSIPTHRCCNCVLIGGPARL